MKNTTVNDNGKNKLYDSVEIQKSYGLYDDYDLTHDIKKDMTGIEDYSYRLINGRLTKIKKIKRH